MAILNENGLSHTIERIVNLLKGKSNTDHKHTKSDITDFPTLGTASSKDVASSGNASTSQVVMGNDTRLSDARKASDVSAWAKASTKPSYTASEVGAYTKEETDTKLNDKANSSHTHGNGDITSLDAGKITSGTISIDRLPQGALDRLIKVVDDTARFKLTTKDVQLGDSVKVTSTKKMYIVVDETKLSSEAGYEPYTADSATSVPWSGVTGKPSTYTPSGHTHTKSQITDFPTSMPASDVSAWAKASSKPSYTKSEVGLGNVDNTADSAKSVKYATSAGSASSASKATGVVDYNSSGKTIQIGFAGDGISGDAIKYIAGYTTGVGDVNAKIKDVSKDALKSWLGLGSLAYSSTSYLPSSGGTLTGDITFTEIGDKAASNGLHWRGSTDGADIYYRTDGSDAGRLVLNIIDDANARIDFALNGTTKSYIDANGNFSGNAASASSSNIANYVYATSHQGTWYQNSQWDGTYFQTNYKYGNDVLPMKVGYSGHADSAGSANSVAWDNVSSKPAIPESDDYSSDNIEALLKKIMGLTPRMGSAQFTKDTHVENTWWNFFYIPHRNGVGMDNGDYGTLLLFPMVGGGDGISYIVRASKGGVVASISSIITSSNISSQSVASATTVNGHTVKSDVPSGAKFTDTVYTHPTTSGNKHIPSGGSSGQILRWSADGTATWGKENSSKTPNIDEIRTNYINTSCAVHPMKELHIPKDLNATKTITITQYVARGYSSDVYYNYVKLRLNLDGYGMYEGELMCTIDGIGGGGIGGSVTGKLGGTLSKATQYENFAWSSTSLSSGAAASGGYITHTIKVGSNSPIDIIYSGDSTVSVTLS